MPNTMYKRVSTNKCFLVYEIETFRPLKIAQNLSKHSLPDPDHFSRVPCSSVSKGYKVVMLFRINHELKMLKE